LKRTLLKGALLKSALFKSTARVRRDEELSIYCVDVFS